MRRTTTPTHKFTMNINPSKIIELNITYSQKPETYIYPPSTQEIILIKTLEDCEIGKDYVSVTLTQEETNMFIGGQYVNIQLHAMDNNNKVYQSNIVKTICREVLNDEVIG